MRGQPAAGAAASLRCRAACPRAHPPPGHPPAAACPPARSNGTLPQGWGVEETSMRQLSVIRLSNNSLSGTLPEQARAGRRGAPAGRPGMPPATARPLRLHACCSPRLPRCLSHAADLPACPPPPALPPVVGHPGRLPPAVGAESRRKRRQRHAAGDLVSGAGAALRRLGSTPPRLAKVAPAGSARPRHAAATGCIPCAPRADSAVLAPLPTPCLQGRQAGHAAAAGAVRAGE